MKNDPLSESPLSSNSFLLDSLFEQSPLGLFVVDSEFKFVKVSKYFAHYINGKPVAEHLGKTIAQVIGKDAWSLLKDYYQLAANGEYIHDVHITSLSSEKPFAQRHYLLTLYPLPEVKKKKLIGGLVQDVSKQYDAEEELLSYQNRLEMAQNAGGVGVFEWDFDTNEVWSSAEEIKLFQLEDGSSDKQNHWLNRIHPDDKDRILKLIESSSIEHQRFDTEFRIILPNKEIKWIRGKGKFFYNEESEAIQLLGVNYDITKRKQEEQFLKFKADTSRLLASQLSYTDALQQTCDLAVKYVADWCTVDILEGNIFKQVAIAHKDPAKIAFAIQIRQKYPATLDTSKSLAEVIRSKKPIFVPILTPEILMSSKMNSEQRKIIDKMNLSSVMILPIIVQSKAIGAISFILAESGGRYTESDLEMGQQLALRTALYIENLQLYDQIKAERQRLIKLFENVPCVVFESTGNIDESDHRMTFINTFAEELLGYPAENWLNIPKFGQSIIHPEDKDRSLLETRNYLETKRPGLLRLRWRKKTGEYIWMEIRFTPILDSNEKVIGLRGVANDISERMKLEQRKDDFIATASHELKTPLTSLKVFSEVLKENETIQSSSKLTQYVTRMETEIDRLTELVFDLLDLSKIQHGQLNLDKKEFPVSELMGELIETIQPTIKHKIDCQCSDQTHVDADRNRLNQVFSNLINNAAKYSPNADKIIVKVSHDEDKVIVSVEDFGIGVPKEYQDHIFQRFYRVFEEADKTFPGLGMGLFISKTIIEKHQGNIWVESTPLEGSTFFVSLPRVRKDKS